MMVNISVCIPTYNQSSYLERSIRSAFHQTNQPGEIIVCDDCSTDNTRTILENLKLEIPILKVFYQPVNVGISKNVDKCLRLATGEFILRLDSDDLVYPDYLEKLSTLLVKFPEAGYGHVAIQEIDQNDKETNLRNLFRTSIYQDADESLKAAVKGYRVAANIVMFRRSALEKVGFITSKINFAEDWRLSIDIAAAGFGNVYLNEVLAAYRVWADSGNVRQHRKLAEIKGINSVFTEALSPAYKNRGWNQQELEIQKADFAAVQADCLGWDNYTPGEKKEIVAALLTLSSSGKVRRMIWIYRNGFGTVMSLISLAKNTLKALIKKLIVR
jgi:glycosyltransferase involved in cell wall biosynthesis